MTPLPIPNKPIRVWGIDLGTTNSAITEVVWEPGMLEPKCHCIELAQKTETGERTDALVPSVVAYRGSELWIGDGAKRLLAYPDIYRNEQNIFAETKNEIGLKKTYARAPEESKHPWHIAGHILKFIREQAERQYGSRSQRTVVTVPASFQINQRQDTIQAARKAGINIGDFDLLDEPTAALIDYLLSPETPPMRSGQSNVMVFDFGGGTCDISTVKLTSEQNGLPEASMLAASRYHRIGGSDIDRAIVHQLMIPELLRQHNIESLALSFTDKKKTLEPILMPRAEALKIALCREIWRLRGHGNWNDSTKATTRTEQPEFTVKLGARELRYAKPTLTAVDFEEVLEPFLEREVLYPHESEYALSCSIFAPITDSLERANLTPTDVTSVLLVGGSSLIPQVQDAVRAFFGAAEIWAYKEYMQTQLAVSRGAAWHAYFMEATGKPFIQPIVPDTIALRAEGRDQYLDLIPLGVTVPFPADGSFKEFKVELPKSGLQQLTMEVVARSTGQRLFLEHWKLPEGTDARDPISIKARLTSNSQLEIQASLKLDPASVFEKAADNPLVNVVNPGVIRLQIQEIEEEIRTAGQLNEDHADRLVELARLYDELGHQEKAIECLRSALRLVNRTDLYMLNLQGIYYSKLGDMARAAQCYEDAVRATPTESTPVFNLSLAYERQGDVLKALEAIEKAISISPNDGPYLVRKGNLLRRLGRETEANQAFANAEEAFPSQSAMKSMSDFELRWYETLSRITGNTERLEAIELEKKRRHKSSTEGSGESDGFRPQLLDQKDIS